MSEETRKAFKTIQRYLEKSLDDNEERGGYCLDIHSAIEKLITALEIHETRLDKHAVSIMKLEELEEEQKSSDDIFAVRMCCTEQKIEEQEESLCVLRNENFNVHVRLDKLEETSKSSVLVPCPICKGSGFNVILFTSNPCGYCSNTGKVLPTEVQVDIPDPKIAKRIAELETQIKRLHTIQSQDADGLLKRIEALERQNEFLMTMSRNHETRLNGHDEKIDDDEIDTSPTLEMQIENQDARIAVIEDYLYHQAKQPKTETLPVQSLYFKKIEGGYVVHDRATGEYIGIFTKEIDANDYCSMKASPSSKQQPIKSDYADKLVELVRAFRSYVDHDPNASTPSSQFITNIETTIEALKVLRQVETQLVIDGLEESEPMDTPECVQEVKES